MKRSRSIRLFLIGSLSAGALAGCGPDANAPLAVAAENVYTNNHHLPGVGYYHAPFRAWYASRYNQFDPKTQRYFQGGAWLPTPHQTITNLSSPLPEVAKQAQARRTDVPRSGFGSTSRGHSSFYS
jgi:hypothetical protein